MSDKGRKAIDRIEQNLMEPADIEKYLRSHEWVHKDDVVEGEVVVYCDLMPDAYNLVNCELEHCKEYKVDDYNPIILHCRHKRPATVGDLIKEG